MTSPEGSCEQGKTYTVETGRADGFGYLGILPPPSLYTLAAIKAAINKGKQGSVITTEGVKQNEAGEAYYEIGYTNLHRGHVEEIGRAAVGAIEHFCGDASLPDEVTDLSNGGRLFLNVK